MANSNARKALEAVRRSVSQAQGIELTDIEDGHMAYAPGVLTFSVRYFGGWEVPADEEDDGDYDWKVPTAETRRALDIMVEKFRKQHPGVDLQWQNDGEKCWLSFTAR